MWVLLKCVGKACGRSELVWVGIHTLRKSGRLSASRADCQQVGQTVRESATLSENRRRRHGGDNVVMETATS